MSSATYSSYEKHDISKPFVQLFIAPRKSGKTYLINKLLRNVWRKEFDYIVIVSPTLEYQDEYPIESYVDADKRMKIYSGFDTVIPQLIEDQKRTQALVKENPKEYKEVHTLMIFDDCIDSNLFKHASRQNVCDQLGERGRHFNMSVVITSQYMTAVSPSLRRQAEALYIFAPLNYAEVDKTLDEYVPKKWRTEFRDRLEQAFEEQYAFLLIDGSSHRRQNPKLRLRKGFTEYLIPLDIREEDEKNNSIKPSRASKRQKKRSTSNDDTTAKDPVPNP